MSNKLSNYLRASVAKLRLTKGKQQKASSRWKKAQAKISKVTRKVANQRQNWVHQVASDIVRCNSFVATEKLEVSKMTRQAKKGKRKKQKAGLNKSILDVGFGMLRSAIEYKVIEAGGVFVEVPTRKVKPSQTCPNCGNQHKKTLDERVHQCEVCGFTLDRDIAAALVMLLWSQGKLPGFETNLVGADVSSSTSDTRKRKLAGSQKQLGQMKRQKSVLTGLDAKTSPSTK
ncbi:MAG: transposase [Potamolinea sp.]